MVEHFGGTNETQSACRLRNPSDFPALSLLPGARASYAPKWSGSFTATYSHDLEGTLLEAALTAKTTSAYSTGSDLIPIKTQAGYTLLNGRLARSPGNSRVTIVLWADNLTNQLYKQSVINAPLQGTGSNRLFSPAAASIVRPWIQTPMTRFLARPGRWA